MNRSETDILYNLMPSSVDWANGQSDWIDVSKFWAFLPSTWPGNGSVLFNMDRGVGKKFQIEVKKLSDLPFDARQIFRSEWETFVLTLPKSLHENLLAKELTNTTVRFRLLGLGGKSRKGIPEKLKHQMKIKYAQVCVFCNVPGNPGGNEGLQIDHKDPKKAFTGHLTVADLQYACTRCNNRKRTALRKHFSGTKALTPAALKWYHDPKASDETQCP